MLVLSLSSAPRNRVADETLPRRIKTNASVRPDNAIPTEPSATSTPNPSNLPVKLCHASAVVAPHKDPPCVKRLKAISSESLRSVSPGSDSVFYSEADTIVDHQVHCTSCGKQVEIVNALSGSDETIVGGEDEVVAPIVQPPADFADSPKGPRTNATAAAAAGAAQHTTRLYKKMDKRFRSEERQGERRAYRTRQENTRAKVCILHLIVATGHM